VEKRRGIVGGKSAVKKDNAVLKGKEVFASILVKVVLIFTALIVVYPFAWMVLTSFKPESAIVKYPPTLFAKTYTFEAYKGIWNRILFPLYFKNSIIFAGCVTIISLLFDSMSGYAFARLQFRGRNVLFVLVLCTLMVPFQVTMIPLFIEIFKMGLINTYLGLVLPRASNAFGIFMMRQFFLTLPKDLEEAGRIDGCNEFRIFWRIMLPLCKPALISLFIFHFMYNWNDLLYPLLLTTTNEMRPIPAGLALFMGQHVIEYSILMAGATIALAPIITAYIISQKYFVKGIAMTGLKG